MRYLGIKPGSLEEAIKKTDEDYQALFKKELKHKEERILSFAETSSPLRSAIGLASA